jgi:hypothetical protein
MVANPSTFLRDPIVTSVPVVVLRSQLANPGSVAPIVIHLVPRLAHQHCCKVVIKPKKKKSEGRHTV